MIWSAWDLTTVSGPTGALPDLERQGRRTSSSPFNLFALSLALIHPRLSCELPLRVHTSYSRDPSPVRVVEGGVGRWGSASQAQPYAKPQATSWTSPPLLMFCLSYCLQSSQMHHTSFGNVILLILVSLVCFYLCNGDGFFWERKFSNVIASSVSYYGSVL